eukprot:6173082-Pleurochrysis_carterae.AAC.3
MVFWQALDLDAGAAASATGSLSCTFLFESQRAREGKASGSTASSRVPRGARVLEEESLRSSFKRSTCPVARTAPLLVGRVPPLVGVVPPLVGIVPPVLAELLPSVSVQVEAGATFEPRVEMGGGIGV